MKPQVSIVIPYYNDPKTVEETLDSLYDTIGVDNFEVILVDDGSKHKLPKSYNRKGLIKINHYVNLGVGQSFDTGVSVARSENLILMGSDIKFLDNGWCSRMINVTTRRPKAVVCASCGSTKTDSIYYGADIVFYVDNDNLTESHPQKSNKNYASILEGRWRPRTGRGVYPVPSIMGAFYGVKKKWYNYICGFEMHYQWGVLEPLISLKSWRLGGEVLVDSDNLALHEFGRSPRREAKYDVIKYNQLMIASTVFGVFGKKYATHLEEEQGIAFNNACKMFQEKEDSIAWFAKYFWEEAKLTPQELEDKVIELSYVYNQEGCTYKKP